MRRYIEYILLKCIIIMNTLYYVHGLQYEFLILYWASHRYYTLHAARTVNIYTDPISI